MLDAGCLSTRDSFWPSLPPTDMDELRWPTHAAAATPATATIATTTRRTRATMGRRRLGWSRCVRLRTSSRLGWCALGESAGSGEAVARDATSALTGASCEGPPAGDCAGVASCGCLAWRACLGRPDVPSVLLPYSVNVALPFGRTRDEPAPCERDEAPSDAARGTKDVPARTRR